MGNAHHNQAGATGMRKHREIIKSACFVVSAAMLMFSGNKIGLEGLPVFVLAFIGYELFKYGMES